MRRKSLLGLVVGILLLGSVVAARGLSRGPGAEDEGDRPLRIMLVGDSVTQGSAGDWTWRYRLWKHLRGLGVDVDFVGPESALYDLPNVFEDSYEYVDPDFDQDHAAGNGETFETSPPIAGLVEEFQPDVVVEMLGINDLELERVSAETVDGRLEDFVESAREVEPGVDLVLSRLPQLWLRDEVAEYNALLDDTAEQLDTEESRLVVATPEIGFNSQDHVTEFAHPNAAGELVIAAAVADALAQLGIGEPYPRPLPDVEVGPRLAPILSATAGDGQVELAWTAPPGASEYRLFQRDVALGEDFFRRPERLVGEYFVVKDLINGHAYEFKLEAIKGFRAAAADIRSNVVRVIPYADGAPQSGLSLAP